MQQKFANVIVDITHEKLDRTFQYLIPESLQGELAPGMAVEVPFGAGNRLIRAYVLSLSDRPECQIGKLKEIRGILRQEVGAESRLIALAAWMREYYGSTMIQAISPGYWAKRAFTLSRSLKEAVRVSLAVPRGTPAELGLPPSATAEDPALTSMQSLWPW